MAVKTPIRTVFDGSGNATGLAEYQSGEFIGLSHGGIGAALSIGTAGQVLKVNSGASALEFGSVEAVINIDGATDLTSATLQTTDLLILSDGGSEGRVTLAQLDTLFSGTSKTLTNKTLTTPTITTPVINAGAQLKNGSTSAGFLEFFEDSDNGTNKLTLIGPASTADVTLTLPASTDTLVGKATTDTLTNKTLTSPTLTTPSMTTPTISSGGLVYEGATADDHETTLTVTDPTADRTITLPNATGNVAVFATAPTAAITDGSVGQALITDGSGVLSFATISASFPESTFLTAPGSSGDFDLAKVPAQTGSAETPFTAFQQDAFGVALEETVFSCNDPKGSTDTVDLGAFS